MHYRCSITSILSSRLRPLRAHSSRLYTSIIISHSLRVSSRERVVVHISRLVRMLVLPAVWQQQDLVVCKLRMSADLLIVAAGMLAWEITPNFVRSARRIAPNLCFRNRSFFSKDVMVTWEIALSL